MTESLIETTETTGSVIKAYFGLSIILQPFIMASLSLLWGLINAMQVIAYLMLFNISMPANVLILYGMLFEIATFDLIDLDWVIEWLDSTFGDLDNNKEVSLSPSALENGYDKTNPFKQTVLPLFIVIVTFIIVGLLKIISYLGSFPLKVYLRIKKMIFWNHFHRLLAEEYIVIALACTIKMYAFDVSNYYETICSIFALLVLISTLSYPVIISRFLYKKFDQYMLHETEFKSKWGEVTLDLQLRDKRVMLFTFFFMVRRWIIVLAIVAAAELPWLQIQVILLLNSFIIIYQGWIRPYKLPILNFKQLMNEVFTMFCSYYMIVYTDFVPDRDTRHIMGWFNIGTCFMMILANFLIIIVLQGKDVHWYLKIKNLKRK